MNKKEAAEYVGVSVRTVERLSKEGPDQRLHPTYKRGPSGMAEAVYSTDELTKLKEERAQPVAVKPSQALTRRTPAGTGEAVATATAQALEAVIRPLLASVQPQASVAPAVPLKDKLALTLVEASEYSGLGVTFLALAIEGGRLHSPKIGPHGSRVILREDLEAFVKAQFKTKARK